MAPVTAVNGRAVFICLALILSAGIFLRLPPALFSLNSAPLHAFAALHPNPKWYEMGLVGPDEGLYRDCPEQLSGSGHCHFPSSGRASIEKQDAIPCATLPARRVFGSVIY